MGADKIYALDKSFASTEYWVTIIFSSDLQSMIYMLAATPAITVAATS
jgi:hypothetical protein